MVEKNVSEMLQILWNFDEKSRKHESPPIEIPLPSS